MLRRSFNKVISALFVLCALAFAVVAIRADYIAAEHTKSTGSPYYIMVNRRMNVVTIYELGDDGRYTKPYKAMICSTARPGHETPLGSFSLTTYKSLWTHMLDGSYGRYVSQFKGNYLFHSVCYAKKNCSSLMTEEYNMLGSPASMGCVRLQVADAKWIYENCPAGTGVTIYDSDDPGPLGKPTRMIEQITPEMDNGWDPTDPGNENPWRSVVPFTLHGSLNLRRAEIYLDGSVVVSCKVACGQDIALLVPCGWYLDGRPIAGFQNNACRITSKDRYSQINLGGDELGAGEHIVEFRCNTTDLPHIEPYYMRAEILVLPDADAVPTSEWQEPAQ